MRNLLHVVEFAALSLLRGVVLLLPLSWAQWLGGRCGLLIGPGFGFRLKVALDNLRAAFPDRPEAELKAEARQSFRSVGITLFELLWMTRLSPSRLRELVRVEHEEVLTTARAAGRGVILLSAHYGSWELVPQALSRGGEDMVTILVRGLANPYVHRAVDRLRRRFGNHTVPSTLAVRELFRTLQRGGLVMMAADQSAPPESQPVRFFGRLTPAFEGPAVLALRTGAALVFGVARRGSDSTYRLALELIPANDLRSDDPTAVHRLTERCLAVTEAAIRVDPSQWMWMHRRWKHIIGAT